MGRELTFLIALWKANLLAAMEYRVAFLSQIIGMMLNNAIYFVFWLIFFDRFQEVKGWNLEGMLLLFGLVAAGFGLAVYLFGNVMNLAEVIAGGRLGWRSLVNTQADLFLGLLGGFQHQRKLVLG